jgi:hypothetical protein
VLIHDHRGAGEGAPHGDARRRPQHLTRAAHPRPILGQRGEGLTAADEVPHRRAHPGVPQEAQHAHLRALRRPPRRLERAALGRVRPQGSLPGREHREGGGVARGPRRPRRPGAAQGEDVVVQHHHLAPRGQEERAVHRGPRGERAVGAHQGGAGEAGALGVALGEGLGPREARPPADVARPHRGAGGPVLGLHPRLPSVVHHRDPVPPHLEVKPRQGPDHPRRAMRGPQDDLHFRHPATPPRRPGPGRRGRGLAGHRRSSPCDPRSDFSWNGPTKRVLAGHRRSSPCDPRSDFSWNGPTKRERIWPYATDERRSRSGRSTENEPAQRVGDFSDGLLGPGGPARGSSPGSSPSRGVYPGPRRTPCARAAGSGPPG